MVKQQEWGAIHTLVIFQFLGDIDVFEDLTNGADLNNFKSTKCYRSPSAAITNSLQNKPSEVADWQFRMYNIANDKIGTGSWVGWQIIIFGKSAKLYLRGHDSTGFNAWREI